MNDRPVRVLLVEDEPADARLLVETLKDYKGAKFVFDHADTLRAGLSKLGDPGDGAPDVLLLDLSLPDSRGLETFSRAESAAGDLPILVLSGYDDENVAITAVREGAQDYLVKGQAEGDLLGRAICYAIERKRSQTQLKASLREKEVLLKEVHHRVKNNLQVICSLLSLQSRGVKDKALFEMFKESRNRIMSMALVHEELYRSRDFAHVDFTGYIKSLVRNLFDSYVVDAGRVTPVLELGSVALDIDKAVPCGLIVNELVCNALKHAFVGRPGGTVTVSLREEADETVVLTVSDDGRGLPEGVNLKRNGTLGLELVNTLTDQLEGDFSYARDGGSAFTVSFRPRPRDDDDRPH